MNIIVFENEAQISEASGVLMAAQVINNPACVLGLATGSTALTPYRTMIALCKSGAVSYEKVTTFNLDEYCKLDPADKNSYRSFMNDNLFSQADFNTACTNFLDGNAADTDAECASYEAKIAAAGGIDIQLLGIGSNGHIAFNEPAEAFDGISHQVALKESTIQDNARFFNSIDEVPTHALTMGIGSIMKAKKILLIALGKGKAQAIQAMVDGPVTPTCPASVLQLHKDVTIMVDKEAASLLK